MSSHHFVKEQQEPAVLFLDTSQMSFDQVSPLLEWVPTVLVWESCLEQVLSWGIKIDVILATEQFQKENLNLLEEQYPVRFYTSTPKNMLKDSLLYLRTTQHQAAHLVGFPHYRALELKEFSEGMDLTILKGDWKYYPVSGSFKKWFPESTLEIFAREGLPVEISNENGTLILPITYITQIEVPEGITEFKSPEEIWIGEKTS
ncbi:thiamine pyrophosphokinase [Algoriphagus sp. CAU 1675]|uniref:thiamine pyrophosphokinase n=1 Tax=Algoriphagus sp. CAU 1675 TaxID=3032597 RepID=UPI0023DBE289|nr:thiamine pyrophosphokinase [Algoriphagus sp. CAU 1675]MDF2156423.1 thiamine pyrophosphokinase [Algoriphagus sp. CAU 1675]